MRARALIGLAILSGCATGGAPTVARSGLTDATARLLELERPRTLRVDVTADDVDLADLCERIGQQVGVNILVDPDLEERITIGLKQLPWREAIARIAAQARCEAEPRCGIVLLYRPPPTIQLQAHDASLRTVLQLLARTAGREIVIPRALRGRVSFAFRGTAYGALREALRQARAPFTAEWEHPVRLVRDPFWNPPPPPPPPRELQPRLIELR